MARTTEARAPARIAAYMLSCPGRERLRERTLAALRGTDWGPLMAAATLTALPVVIFFVIIHRRIAFGLTAGAVRG